MAADPILSRELTALREELSVSRRQRQPAQAESQAAGETKAASAGAPEQLEELQELLDETVKFVEEAGKNLSTHPVANVVVAFVAGIMIGRLFGRRREL